MKASDKSMIDAKLNRRQFLVIASTALGASAVACSPLSAPPAANVDEDTEETQNPAFPESSYGDQSMNKKILVTYASQGGSAAGIADAVAKKMSESGLSVDVRPVAAVKDLAPYSAVVIGSAIHSGEWLPEAMAFIKDNQAALRRMPTALFQVCMMLAADPVKNQKWADGWLAPVSSLVHPASVKSFAGMLYPDRYSKLSEKLGLRIFLATIKLKPGDYRDWDAIDTWADSITRTLS